MFITLTTDFGEGSTYVAAMKGVILGLNPWASLIDLSHRIPPQDLRYTAYFLANVLPCFERDVLHVVVVDPGVGTDRQLLYVEAGGHRLLVPDNGCWTTTDFAAPPRVRRLAEPSYWRHPVSNTFHGRDILAPVAAHLSLGLDPALLGPETSDWVTLEPSRPHVNRATGEVIGEVQFVDDFGNLITNISAQALFVVTQSDPSGRAPRRTAQRHDWPATLRVRVGDGEVPRFVRTYADAAPGSLVFLFSSGGRLEVAAVQGSAARQLGATAGTRVVIAPNSGSPAP
jgi:S-adenosyl-L-methionine hydrolase (adenosine-forming)